MIFYHVDRTKLLKPNQILDFTSLPSRCNQEIINYCQDKFENKLSRFGITYTAYALPANHDYPIFTAEIFLELYRQHHFPDLPSRYQSICASDSIEQACFWHEELKETKNEDNDCHIAIFQSEKFFKADAAWRDVIAGNLSISTVELWCENYWTGKPFETLPRIEYLLPLPLQVKDIIYSPFK